jgi:hypothetical protein
LQSNGSIDRPHYFRILTLACIDVLLTLPFGVISTTIDLLSQIRNPDPGMPFRFYYGWAIVHSNWRPAALPYPEFVGDGLGTWQILEFYFSRCTSPILAIAIFSLFGLTSDARAAYWHGFCTVAKSFGWTPPAPRHDDLGEIEFGARQLTVTER